MELVDGVSLATVLEEGPIPHDDAVAIAIGVSEALQAAHSAGVVHGNLKPSNVLITDGGGKQPLVKVSDFTGHGHPHEDMYSLGQLMEAMSGRNDPAARDPIVERLLSREPYSPAQLRAILIGSSTTARNTHNAGADADDLPETDLPETDRPRLMRLAIVTGAVTLAVVIAVCAWFLKPSTPPEIQSETPFSELAPPTGDTSPPPSATPVASRQPAAAPAAGTGANAPSPVRGAKAVVSSQLKAGNIEPEAAAMLNSKLDEIGRFLSRGQTKQANDRLDSLKTMLMSMRRSNRVNTTGYDAILASLNDLSAG